MHHEIHYRRVTEKDHSSMQGFAAVYQSAFAEAPYFESYDPNWIIDFVWKPHIPHCLIVAQTEADGVVGIACAHLITEDVSSVGAFLQSLSEEGAAMPFPLHKTVYMSELAVLAPFRGRGIGRSLVLRRHDWAKEVGLTHYCMRTAEQGSNSQHLYQTLGARRAPFIQDMSDGEVKTESNQRIFLYGLL